MVDREQGKADRSDERVVLEHAESNATVARRMPEMTAEDAEFERAMAAGRKVMSDHHAVLVALAR